MAFPKYPTRRLLLRELPRAMKKLLLCVLLLLLGQQVRAQAVQILQRTIVGPKGLMQTAPIDFRNIQQLGPNRLLLLGSAYAIAPNLRNESPMFWVINRQGDTVRTAVLRRPNNDFGRYDDAAVLPGGDLLLAGRGYSRSPTTVEYNLLVRTDSLGSVRWERHLNAGGLINDFSTPSVLALADGGALLAYGVQHPLSTPTSRIAQAAVARVDSTGAVVWQRVYGRPYSNFYHLVAQANGSYALAGYQDVVPAPSAWSGTPG